MVLSRKVSKLLSMDPLQVTALHSQSATPAFAVARDLKSSAVVSGLSQPLLSLETRRLPAGRYLSGCINHSLTHGTDREIFYRKISRRSARGNPRQVLQATVAQSEEKATVEQSRAFQDPRWIKGTWDISTFTKDGKVDWDAVIDAEVKRRKWLEDNPEASSNNDPVLFETSSVPWWAWVKRFHLPEAELLNGRAAMVGYFSAYLVDSLTGVGLVDQQSSFLGKTLLFVSVLGVLFIRKTGDVVALKELAKESTFYDKQWQATWKETNEESNPLD